MGDERLNKIAVDIVYEGMAVWAATQYLYQIGETQYAMQTEIVTDSRSDAYGWGSRLYKEQYPLNKDGSLIKLTPYSTFPPLDPTRVKEFILESVNSVSQNEKNWNEHSEMKLHEQIEEANRNTDVSSEKLEASKPNSEKKRQ